MAKYVNNYVYDIYSVIPIYLEIYIYIYIFLKWMYLKYVFQRTN